MPETEAGCADDLVCEEVVGEDYPACFPPVTVAGRVFDLATEDPIEGARVVARDANFAAVSGVAASGADGTYVLAVPTPRNPDGTLPARDIFQRSDAADYLTFPTAPRVALPIDVASAVGDPPQLASSATDIGLVALPAGDRGTLSGRVIAEAPIGTLVVAGGAANAGGGTTGLADYDGSYVVFNVPTGTVDVRGFKAGLQIPPVTADISTGEATAGVDLTATGEATATVTGSVQIVNGGNGTETSVILVVDETFVPDAARGEAPPGLRAHPVTGSFSIAGVPDGNYVVLAAFENDNLVRDPDTSIGGTSIVRITVAGGSVDLPEGFKVTGSLDDVSPDDEEIVSATPTFSWADDSGEDHYELRVFDAFGALVWEQLDVPGVSGNDAVQVEYAGPPLQSGLLYQLRATSIKNGGSPLSVTEDLKGTFVVE